MNTSGPLMQQMQSGTGGIGNINHMGMSGPMGMNNFNAGENFSNGYE